MGLSNSLNGSEHWILSLFQSRWHLVFSPLAQKTQRRKLTLAILEVLVLGALPGLSNKKEMGISGTV
jgi:hypothetical protein